VDTAPLLPSLARSAWDGFEQWRALDADLRFYGTVAIGAGALGLSYWREHHGIHRLAEKRLPPLGPPPLYQRPFRRFVEPLDVGGVRVDFFEQHLDILAMSGGYKTTLLASLARQRLRAGRPVVVVTGGQSPALEQEIAGWGGWVIRPRSAAMTFNAFEGDPLFVAQGWAELLPTTSEAKVFHSIFELAVLAYLRSRTDYRLRCSALCRACRPPASSAGKPSTHDGLRRFVLAWDPPDAENIPRQRVRGMKESYGLRLMLLEEAFGGWIGQELSVAEAVRRHIPVMFVLDASTDPDFNRFSTVLVWWAVNHAVFSVGGFDVFVDELARLDLPPKLLGEQLRTWRVNDCHFLGGTHASDDLKGVLNDLIQLHVFGRLSSTATTTRQHAQAATYDRVPAANFGRHSLKKGQFVVVDHEDRVQLGKVPTYRCLPNPRGAPLPRVLSTYRCSGQNGGTGAGWAVTAKGRQTVVGATSAVEPEPESVGQVRSGSGVIVGPPQVPRWVTHNPSARKLELWLTHWFPLGALDDGAHYYTPDSTLKGKGKRPGCEYRGLFWTTYDLIKALDDSAAMGLDRDDEAAYLALVKMGVANGELSVDHKRGCENPRCVRAEHLDWLSKTDNIAVFWQRRQEKREQAKKQAAAASAA
jgi:hypothetical protein